MNINARQRIEFIPRRLENYSTNEYRAIILTMCYYNLKKLFVFLEQ